MKKKTSDSKKETEALPKGKRDNLKTLEETGIGYEEHETCITIIADAKYKLKF